ncbi:unnamed protein product, partial [marine sediment metagenome]
GNTQGKIKVTRVGTKVSFYYQDDNQALWPGDSWVFFGSDTA